MSPIPMVTAAQLRDAVRFPDLIEPVAHAFQASSLGRADNALIVMFPGDSPAAGDVLVKTGTLRDHPVYVVKIAPWFAVNAAAGHRQGGLIAVFDSHTGLTLALLDDEHYLSDIRTAAAGSIAARTLAPKDVHTALVVGAGTQAYWQPRALHHERPFQRLLIWARTPGKAEQLTARLAPALPDVDIRPATDLEAAARAADVILTTTQARQPLIHGDWLRPGQHITAVGADDATKCELDATALHRARVFVDEQATALATGDVHRAVTAGRYTPGDLAGELGDILNGAISARADAHDITIATLSGIGAQDVVSAQVALHKLGILTDLRSGRGACRATGTDGGAGGRLPLA